MREMKKCPNCGTLHTGMFDDCYPCFDTESEIEYEERRVEAIKEGRLE